jgi:hypothetical protein
MLAIESHAFQRATPNGKAAGYAVFMEWSNDHEGQITSLVGERAIFSAGQLDYTAVAAVTVARSS